MKDKILLVGGGGHCRSCIDVIEMEGKFRIIGIIDLKEKIGENIFGYPIIGYDNDLPKLVKSYPHVLITLGQIKTPKKRIELYLLLKKFGAIFPIVRSPLAHISQYAKINDGTIIMHHVIVNSGAIIGSNCIINTNALIEHDVVVEDYCHISTGAIINGGSKIKSGTFIGSNVICREGISIGRYSIIGAGCIVMGNIGDRMIVKFQNFSANIYENNQSKE